jgi:hypothetical protein
LVALPLARETPANDNGAVAVLAALSMLTLLLIAGMVLDFGLARADRTTNKASADAAVLAGVRDLTGTDFERKPWRGVCSAIAYLRANGPQLDLPDTASGTYTNGNDATVSAPCTPGSPLQEQTCSPADHSTWARWSGRVAASRCRSSPDTSYPPPPGDPFYETDQLLTLDNGTVADPGL